MGACHGLLIERWGFTIMQQRVTGRGTCPDCGEPVAGVWA